MTSGEVVSNILNGVESAWRKVSDLQKNTKYYITGLRSSRFKYGPAVICVLEDRSELILPKRYALKLGAQCAAINKLLQQESTRVYLMVDEDPEAEDVGYVKLKFGEEEYE